MSFESLPEEIISRIAKLTAAAAYFEVQFNSSVDCNTDGSQNTWNEDRGLASVDRRMRRICMPTLFARVCLRTTGQGWPPGRWTFADLQTFRKMVVARPHIAEHVTSISLGYTHPGFLRICCLKWSPHYDEVEYIKSAEQMEILAGAIPILPKLTKLPPLIPTDSLICAVNAHPSLTRVDIFQDDQLDVPLNNVLDGYLRKIYFLEMTLSNSMHLEGVAASVSRRG